MAGKSVFIVGPGFIGWNVLDLLVSEGYSVTGLVRREEHAAGIRKSGGTAILGDLEDKKLIADETEKVEIVLHTATADHIPSAEAVLDGVKRRAGQGKSTIYIHTSGTSVLDDNAQGAFKGDKIYRDSEPDAIDAALADDAPHRPIDLTIIRAQQQLGDRAKIAIMTPPEIYGYNAAHGRQSIQVTTVARFALKHGFAPYVGAGLSVESQVHVMDLARAYIVLLHAMEKQPASWTLANPYFYCENGKEFSWKEVAEQVAHALVKAGRWTEAKTKTADPDTDYPDLMGVATACVLGGNSRTRAVRLRDLGWQPREKSLWQSFNEDELSALLREWDARKE